MGEIGERGLGKVKWEDVDGKTRRPRVARAYEMHDHIIETFHDHVVTEDAIKEWK